MPNELFIDRIGESFFPMTCSFCRQRYPPADTPFDGVCRRCLNQLPIRKGTERLVRLRAATDEVPAAVCACYYEGIVQKALIRMKFGDSPEICATFADLITDALLRIHPNPYAFTAVVAVPLHAAREKERGYNQAALIADSISRRLLLPDWTCCLARGRATGRQSELLTMAERQDNVANAFVVISPERILRQHLILVDDILSTGATLLSLRQSILQAGAASVTMTAAASGNTGPTRTDYT